MRVYRCNSVSSPIITIIRDVDRFGGGESAIVREYCWRYSISVFSATFVTDTHIQYHPHYIAAAVEILPV